MITIVLAEDHAGVREMLKDLLAQERDFQIVGEAADGLSAVRLVTDLQPDALVTDLMMPGLTGFEVIERIQPASPKTRIVVVSIQTDKPYLMEAFRRGADGFVQKQFSSTHLVPTLRAVLAGGCHISPPDSASWLSEAQPDKADGTLDLFETLTSQQRQLLRLAAAGHTDSEIAGQLLLYPVTVAHLRAALMKKFSLQSQAELVRFAADKDLKLEAGDR